MVILGGERRQGSRIQRAVEVTAMRYVANERIDVSERLRIELESRGVTDVDAAWVERVAVQIRAGQPVDYR